MNNRMASDGCSNSGSRSGNSGSGSVTNASSEQPAAEEATTNTVARYPKRVRRHVDYNEQLNPTDDDCFICK